MAFNYTYSDSKITKGEGKSDAFNDLPLHVANLGLDWQATDVLSLWGNAQYRSKTRNTGAAQIPEHVLVDVGAEYGCNDAVTGNLAIYNIGDRQFDNSYTDGRRVYVGLTSTF